MNMTTFTRTVLVLAVLSAVVIAAALSVSAALDVVEHRQSAESWEQIADSIMGVGGIGEVRTESTTTVTQASTHISGTGAEPSETVELLSEGLWVVSVRFSDYEPPEVGAIPTVNLSSVSGSGGAGWSGNWWNHIYVTADRDWGEGRAYQPFATFTPGEVVLHISDLPDDVMWFAKFERIGELQPE